jgi:hypothetical protein
MCLTIKKGQKVKTAKADITCYKFLKTEQTDAESETIYCTPFYMTHVEIGETYTSAFTFFEHEKHGEVEAGLHSLKNIESCDIDIYMDSLDKAIGKRIVECIIPKGSKYYKGLYSRETAYASDTLKYVRIVPMMEYAEQIFKKFSCVFLRNGVYCYSLEEFKAIIEKQQIG